MINKFEIEGKWSNATKNDWIHGKLTFDPETRISISIFGSFTEDPIPFRHHKIDLVVGKTPMGVFTLVDLDYRSFKSSRNFGTITTYNVTFIFKGIQVQSKDDLIFREASFSTFNLEPWFNPPNMKIEHNFEDWSFKIEGRSTSMDDIILNGDITCNIYHDASLKPENDSNRHIVEQFTELNLSYVSKENWLRIWEDIKCFVTFISFCTNEQSYPTKFELKDNAFIEKIGSSTRNIPVEVYFPTTFFHSGSIHNNIMDHIIPYSIVEENFDVVLNEWFGLYKTFHIPINLINSRLKSKRHFTENRFLDAAHAVEVFHRLESDMNKFSIEYFEKLKNAAMDAFPEPNNDRDWMEQLLRYANEPNLRQRLKDLINRYELDFLFEDNKAKKNFINMAINTRNYFTHYDSSIKPLKASGPELIYTTRLLSAILYACITAKLSIDRSKSRRIIQEMMERL
ncbi:hypothetical protein GTQ34_12135 [Muricauda sp. JGD-17]|uniref:ApeA N-terminal domain-containing protein n=1 Tax=Flagellimonas ochracea TaxID=2696472 RepID=A0A964TD24_9FLAO|nr:HEPN domain-containing protein [Allomuricauda ochracea]NAY92667.1 hypothetical protein [Allomuricauda ochracea]